MMTNLFSMFDPSIYFMKSSWLMLVIPMVIMTKSMKKKSIKMKKMLKFMMKFLLNEIQPLLSKSEKKSSSMFFVSVFLLVLMMNIMAMLPFCFTTTAHIILALPISLIIWLGMMIYGWVNNYKNMMSHTVPSGTPNSLMNFMVLIEMISNFIRPLTLSIRLSSNMVAGHLLLSLLANFTWMSISNMVISFPMMNIMVLLELSVSVIQAYVLMTLLTLYSTEIH